MVDFGPRFNAETGKYDPPFERMKGSRFTTPKIKNDQTETTRRVNSTLRVPKNSREDHVRGLVADMNRHITIIERNGDRGQAQFYRQRIAELQKEQLSDGIVRAFEELHGTIIYNAQEDEH